MIDNLRGELESKQEFRYIKTLFISTINETLRALFRFTRYKL